MNFALFVFYVQEYLEIVVSSFCLKNICILAEICCFLINILEPD